MAPPVNYQIILFVALNIIYFYHSDEEESIRTSHRWQSQKESSVHEDIALAEKDKPFVAALL